MQKKCHQWLLLLVPLIPDFLNVALSVYPEQKEHVLFGRPSGDPATYFENVWI